MKIVCTVTNDLTYDQRMQRICRTLTSAGHEVTLLGRVRAHSISLNNEPFRQVRLRCPASKGPLFYLLFNLQLAWWLLWASYDAVCSVDFDTLPAGWLITLLRRKKRVFDAHEYFTEVPEVTHRPVVKAIWHIVGRVCLRSYRHAYTVGPSLAKMLTQTYGPPFVVVRNVPFLTPLPPQKTTTDASKVLLYQGALNEGRGIETALESLKYLPDSFHLWLVGEGDLSALLRQQAHKMGLEARVRFWGYVRPTDLHALTEQAWLGLNLLENKGLSYYYSLANKFFDYVQATVPVLTMDFPEYRALCEEYAVAQLLPNLSSIQLAETINYLAENEWAYTAMQTASYTARTVWTWEKEQAILLGVWAAVEQES